MRLQTPEKPVSYSTTRTTRVSMVSKSDAVRISSIGSPGATRRASTAPVASVRGRMRLPESRFSSTGPVAFSVASGALTSTALPAHALGILITKGVVESTRTESGMPKNSISSGTGVTSMDPSAVASPTDAVNWTTPASSGGYQEALARPWMLTIYRLGAAAEPGKLQEAGDD